MNTLIECEIVSTNERVWLPADAAHRMAALGRVRLPEPRPDMRYAPPATLPLRQTWQGGRFWPAAGYTTRLH